MARPPNQSGRPPANTLDGDDLTDSLEGIGKRYGRRSIQDINERRRLEQAQDTLSELNNAAEEDPSTVNAPFFGPLTKKARSIISRVGPRVQTRRMTTYNRAFGEAERAIDREFGHSAVNGQVSNMSRDPNVQSQSLSMINTPTYELEQMRAGHMKQMNALHGRSSGILNSGLFDREARLNEGKMNDFRAVANERQGLIQQMAMIDVAMRRQRGLGTDDESKLMGVMKSGGMASEILFKNSVQKELEGGTGLGSMNIKQLKEQEVQQAKALTEALTKLQNSASMSAEQIGKLRDEAGATANDLKKTQEAIRQGGGSRGGFNYATAGAAFGMLGGMTTTAGAAYAAINVHQRNQIMDNRIGAAAMSNQMYDRRSAAIAGDMTQLSVMSSGIWGKQEFYAAEGADAARKAVGANVVGGSLEASAGVLGTIGSLRSGNISGAMSGAGSTVNSAAAASVASADLARDVSATSQKLADRQRALALADEMSKVPGAMRQKFYDYSAGMRNSANAIGGTAGSTFFEMTSGAGGAGMLKRMEDARLGPDQMAALSAQGGADMGSTFNANQIFAARGLERSGFGTMGANMQRMGTLAAAGAHNPQEALRSVMEAAMTKSLDGSKALNAMVENTAALVGQSGVSAALGLNSAGASATALARMVDPTMANKEGAIAAGMNELQRINQLSTGTGINYTDLSSIADIQKRSGIGRAGALEFRKMAPQDVATLDAELKGWDGMSEDQQKALRQRMMDQGLGEFISKDKKTGKFNLNKERWGQAVNAKGDDMWRTVGAMVNKDGEGTKLFKAGKLTWEQFEDQYYEEASALSANFKAANGVTARRAVGGGFGGTVTKDAAGNIIADAMDGKGGSANQRTSDDLLTAGATNNVKEIREATAQLGGVAIALQKINEATQGLVAKMDGGGGKEMMTAASKAAETFDNGSMKFATAVKDFGEIVKNMTIDAGAGSIKK
jgi:hypothetical protein